jgi:methenyltetrahydromethanopterin cyclohydrolase
MLLNTRAMALCEQVIRDAETLRIETHELSSGGRVIDLGVATPGGFEAGRRLAEICLSGLGEVQFVPARTEVFSGLAVQVRTDHPRAACMASQYAGWEVSVGDYFAMGSGPMRAAAGRETLFERIGLQESAERVVGSLEASQLPGEAVLAEIAAKCGVEPSAVTLLVAPTASQAGNVQVVARSVETALHKLDTLGFDLGRIESGWGAAPLPPVAADDLAGIGRTNDAILYGGEVVLHVRGDDASLQEVGPRAPSCASADHGQPFAVVFEKHGRDFYQIDPALFSPAVVTLANLDTGNSFRFGHALPRVIHESFGGQ